MFGVSVTIAKGIGNGFPLAAVVTTQEVASCLQNKYLISTFGGNPLACAAGSAVLDVSITTCIILSLQLYHI